MDRYASEYLTTLSLTVFTQINFVAAKSALFDGALFDGKRPFCILSPENGEGFRGNICCSLESS